MARFFALPVGSGDAFVLLAQDPKTGAPFSVLVDGGRRGSKYTDPPVVAALNKHLPRLRKLDVVICTHKDRDHSGGLTRLADFWTSGQIGEYWLPGRWATVAATVLEDPANTLHIVLDAVVQLVESLRHTDGLKSRSLAENVYMILSDAYAKATDGAEYVSSEYNRHEIETEDRKPITRISRALGKEEQWVMTMRDRLLSGDPPSHYSCRKNLPVHRVPLNKLQSTLYLSAVDTADEIWAIVRSAVIHDIPVRWFDFGEFERTLIATGGRPDFLEPVNAQELICPPPRPVSPLAFLACLYLTRQNVESLVFHHPETDSGPAVLFTGDSRLAFGINRPQQPFPMPSAKAPSRRIIATAPHHGSCKNDYAYKVIETWAKNGVAYVRNGGRFNQRFMEFTKRPSRTCAYCWQHSQPGQLVQVNSSGRNWNWRGLNAPMC